MHPRLDLRISQRLCPAPSPAGFPSPSTFTRKPVGPVVALLALSLAAATLAAQQPYGYQSPQYSSQYAAPSQQYSYPPQQQYGQPQYQQPQYEQPQYQQPQDQQPQYQQPQYDQQQPQYQQPQGYADPQYGQQPQYPQQQADAGQPYAPDDLTQPQQPTQAPLNAGDLEQLLAPIALYPDNLLAQVLAAATYPAEVASADQWVNQMRAQGYGSPDQIAAGANAQGNWDPSIKALTAYPQVLDYLNQNLQWTTALGNAYYNQPEDVMEAVQVLRERAQQAGNLQSTPQEQVTDDQGYVDIAPTDPEVVYVPTYDPWVVYGAPIVAYPGFSVFGGYFGLGIHFGLGCALNAFMPFGWMGFGLNWFAHAIFFNHGYYYSHSRSVADWGFPHGGPRAYGGRGGFGNGGHPMPGGRMAGGYGERGGAGYGRGNGFANRTPQPGNRAGYGGNAFQRPGYNNYGGTHAERPGQMAYNRGPQGYAGGAYAHSGYGYNYGGRSGMSYSSPYNSYRQPSFQSPAYRAPQSNMRMGGGYGGQSFARSEPYGGFRGYSGGGYSGGRVQSYGGGHFSGGGMGHYSAPHYSAPHYSTPHFSGGGGGGHFSRGGGGGGHSGGGHRR